MRAWLTLSVIILLVFTACQKEGARKRSGTVPVARKVKVEDRELKAWEKMLDEETYHTRLKAYNNPFKPFFVKKKPVRTVSHVSSPLQKWSLKELRFTGVICKRGRCWALIEDPTGKGYMVAQGARIGSEGGVIIKISRRGYLLVQEKVYDFLGQEHLKQYKIYLRPTEESS
ncbi:pilus assembly protein PilP [Thermosulfurimonas sp.]|uniref:pilus assembly protein PilP n=1 Tax=Thermosulfurimonas sp. TaxID=2080236 RepID=UPI0025DA647A|nr:pilus assembly protein PilP [Thermosulfurimonas sp.]